MSGFTRPSTLARVFEVDYFFQRRASTPPGAQGVLELPQQPISIEELDVHQYQAHYSINGERIIRRPIQQHKPKRITLNFIISPYGQFYPAAAPGSPLGPTRNASVFFPNAMSSKEVLERFNELVQEMRSADNRYDFINIKNGIIYRDCELENFVVAQNVNGTRLGGYSVSITFICYQKAAFTGNINRLREPRPFVAPNVGAELSTYEKIVGAMQSVANKMKGIADTINGAGATVTDAIQNNRLLGATLNITDAAISLPLSISNSITNTIAAIENVRDAVANRTGQALQAVSTLLRATAQLEKFVGQLLQDPLIFLRPITEAARIGATNVENSAAAVGAEFSRLFGGSEDIKLSAQNAVLLESGSNELLLNDLLLTIAEANYLAELSYGFLYRRAPRHPGLVLAGTFLADDRNIAALASFSGNSIRTRPSEDQQGVPYVLRMGETLMDLAHRLTGDPARWVELASFNGWASPYTDSQDRVARAGTLIQIPLALAGVLDGDFILNTLINRGDPLLTDMKLDSTGDIIMDVDINLVSGADNFKQALLNRARTVKGEQLSLPEYGLANLAGSLSGDLTPALFASELTTQLLRDPRVQSVSDVAVELTGDMVDVKLVVSSIDQQATNLVIPLN